ncbi:MAG TPA: cytidylate kinase-like family protein, partial [Lachnospiraceae bacterium]|nr:cytidylate kinase-like family protein [Lachnospiraceae bacterium]
LLEVDEKLRRRSFSKMLRELPRQLLPLPVTKKFQSEDKLFRIQSEIIRNLADTESCIIVGKCADYILRDYQNVFRVYIEAPRDYCVKRVISRMHCEEAKAHALISKTDRYRAAYYEYYTHGNLWTRPENYDFILNSESFGEQNCIQIIKEGVRLKLKKDL